MDASNGEDTQIGIAEEHGHEARSRDSGNDASSSSSNSSRESSEEPRELTPTQHAINLLLNVPPLSSDDMPVEAMKVLKSMEVRKLPKSIAAGQLKPKHVPHTCCFDATRSQASWCAQKLCQRCAAFSQVLRASRGDASSHLTKSIMGISFYLTSCIIDTQNFGKPGCLPIELLSIVVDYAIEGLRNTKDGEAVATLLHVSSAVRYQIIKAFAPIKLYDVLVPPDLGTAELRLPEELLGFISSVTRWAFRDVTERRHCAGAQPHCTSTDKLTFSNGKEVRHGMISMIVSPQDLDPAVPPINTQRHYRSDGLPLSINGVSALVLSVLHLRKPIDPRMSNFPPRSLNIHQRALGGSLCDPTKGTVIEFCLLLKESVTDDSSKWFSRRWKFYTSALQSSV